MQSAEKVMFFVCARTISESSRGRSISQRSHDCTISTGEIHLDIETLDVVVAELSYEMSQSILRSK